MSIVVNLLDKIKLMHTIVVSRVSQNEFKIRSDLIVLKPIRGGLLSRVT